MINKEEKINFINVVNGHVRVISAEYGRDINIGNTKLSIFYTDDTCNYRVLRIKNKYIIITISRDLANSLSEEIADTLIWHSLIEYTVDVYKNAYYIERDYTIDNCVAAICGYANTISALEYLREKIDNSKNIDERISRLEENLYKNNISNITIDIIENKIKEKAAY